MAQVVSGPGRTVILGAGVTGLAAARASGLPVFEKRQRPGGLCASYYVRPGGKERLATPPEDGRAFRFEVGGGHWIFGATPLLWRLLERLAPLARYQRRAAVYFPDRKLYVPYPLQNHLSYLGADVAAKVIAEMERAPRGRPLTLADWLEQSFGPTLTELFFAPFHQAYTAGLWTCIAPRDTFKSPVDLDLVRQGASGETPAVGYNAAFGYPVRGLDALISGLARGCRVHCQRGVLRIDPRRKHIEFVGGSGLRYEVLVSTLPLSEMLRLTGLEVDDEPDPHTRVHVLNIGAWRGPAFPPEVHWIYVPNSTAGFYRVGFYSNVDASFAPPLAGQRVSLYVERAFRPGDFGDTGKDADESFGAVEELRRWGFITEVEAVSTDRIEVAYTWRRPGSRWREQALARLQEHDIFMTGRYGKWVFQGIAESIQDGLAAGAAVRGLA